MTADADPPGSHPAVPLDDDAVLLLAIAARRDRQAFGVLFARFAPRLKSWFMRAGTASDRAEDLAQETMLAVWRRSDSYDPARAGVATWIFTIARNQRIDALRRLARPVPDAEDPSFAPPEPVAPDAAFGASQDEQRIRAALAELSAEQAEVIRLAFYEDRPHSEIERTLGIPLGTVKSRLRLAMVRLRARLAEPQQEGRRA
jgi:RNA polymerase sigma-70 factor (ECF subfamily)